MHKLQCIRSLDWDNFLDAEQIRGWKLILLSIILQIKLLVQCPVNSCTNLTILVDPDVKISEIN